MSSPGPETNQPQQDNEAQPQKRLTRRRFFEGVLTGSVLTVLAGGAAATYGLHKHKETGWLTDFNNDIPIDPAQGDVFDRIDGYNPSLRIGGSESSKQYLDEMTDRHYLQQLLESLSRNTVEVARETAETAIRQSLRLTRGPHDTLGGYGTATLIDEGGLYLTARHVVTQAPINYITNPYTNQTEKTAAVFIHPTADMAVVVAPTGQPPKPVVNIRFSSALPQLGERLRLVGLWPKNGGQPEVYRYQKSGTVHKVGTDRIAVDGLVPLGGTSGSPIINEAGSIVGVESGLYLRYPHGPNKLSNYEGAIIIPITSVGGLSQSKAI